MQNTWGEQADVTLTLTGLSATTAVGTLTELIEVKPGWGTLNWGENGWGSVECHGYNFNRFIRLQQLLELWEQLLRSVDGS